MSALDEINFVWGEALGLGGTETRMLEVAEALGRSGTQVRSLAPTSVRGSALDIALARVVSSQYYYSGLHDLRRHMRKNCGDYLTFGLKASLAARLAKVSGAWRVRLFDCRNGMELGRPSGLWAIDRVSQRLVTAYITNSFSVSEMLVQRSIHAGRIEVLVGALDPSWAQGTDSERGTEDILIVGNSRPEKAHDVGLRALAQLPASTRVSIFTDDATNLVKEWEGLCDEDPNPRAAVSFFEGQRVTPEVMARHRILFHPSRSESLPRVVLEALAQGLHVVATDVGDCPRLLSAQGDLVEVDNADDMSRALRAALKTAPTPVPSKFPTEVLRGPRDYCRELIEIIRSRA